MKKTKERIMGISKAYLSGNPPSVVIVIPKKVQEYTGNIEGTRFLVKLDEKNRIIYEPIKEIPASSQTIAVKS